MKYKLIDNQVKIKQTNPSWLFYILIPLTFLGYYFYRKAFKFDGVLSEIITVVILFMILYGGYYILAFILPKYRFRRNLIGNLEINNESWTTPSMSLTHKDLESIIIRHEFIKRNTYTFDGNDYSWYFSVKINELQLAFFIETNDQIEYLRKWLVEYYKRGIEIDESFGDDELSSYILFTCEDGDDIKKIKDQYF